jgi:hypothetical protein
MADEVWEEIASALSTIVTTTDKSGNMKEMKITIAETVSTLRKLLSMIKSISESKTKNISELEKVVNNMKA